MRALVKEKRPWLRRSSIYLSYGKGLRSARKDVDVGRQEDKSCVGMEKAGNEGCIVDMETRRQDYNQVRGEAKRAKK